MSTFRIRDLMVTVRPAAEAEQPAQDDPAGQACLNGTNLVCPPQNCQLNSTIFGGANLTCPRQSCQANSTAFEGTNLACPRQSCQGNSTVCVAATGCPGGGVSCQAGCSWLLTRTPVFEPCGSASDLCNVCQFSQPPGIALLDQPGLAALKEQLAVAMQQIEQRNDVLRRRAEETARSPQTLAEVDALERGLTQALEELQARRAELEQAPAPQPEPRQGT